MLVSVQFIGLYISFHISGSKDEMKATEQEYVGPPPPLQTPQNHPILE